MKMKKNNPPKYIEVSTSSDVTGGEEYGLS
jgi:hypothetical protein